MRTRVASVIRGSLGGHICHTGLWFRNPAGFEGAADRVIDAYCFSSTSSFGSGRYFGSGRSAAAVGTLFDPGGVFRQAAARSLSKFRMSSLDLLSCAAVPRTVIAEMPDLGTM